MFAVWKERLELAPLLLAVRHPGAGAIDVFMGVVRDNHEGRDVTALEYEAYETMAVSEMRAIGAEIMESMPGVRVAAFHRIGRLHVGEQAVLCVASAPHRHEAFVACRRMIDEIKSRVPIWKREHGPGGPHWVGWEDARCGAEGHGDHAHKAR